MSIPNHGYSEKNTMTKLPRDGRLPEGVAFADIRVVINALVTRIEELECRLGDEHGHETQD